MAKAQFDSLLVVSFGGPEGPDDILPFLENVLRGRNVPESRKLEVAEHYHRFGGVSPINQQNRELVKALQQELGSTLPVYWANRHWHPLLPHTLQEMASDGFQHSLVFLTSAFSSFAGCRQYLDAIDHARRHLALESVRFSKLRAYFNHPRFVTAWSERVEQGIRTFSGQGFDEVHVLFSAHSIPTAMAAASPYVGQLSSLCELLASRSGIRGDRWQLVYQSRSGPPHQAWLEPDVSDAIARLGDQGVTRVVLVPVGFLSDHIEVLYDLDEEAAGAARRAGVQLVRTPTLGPDPGLVTMVRELVEERLLGLADRPVLGDMGPAPDECPDDCCRFPTGPPS